LLMEAMVPGVCTSLFCIDPHSDLKNMLHVLRIGNPHCRMKE